MVYSSGMVFDRQTTDCPGPITAAGPNRLVMYAPHPSGQCSIAAWWPKTNYSNAPWCLMVRGGLNYLPGERGSMDLSAMAAETLAATLAAKGYVVFSIDYPGSASNRDDNLQINDIAPLALWPDAVYWVARAVQFIRDNYIGSSATRFGTTLLGAGNSIAPEHGAGYGNSWGCTILMMLGLLPDRMLPYMRPTTVSRDWSAPKSSHRLRAIMGFQGQVDLTQFDIEPLNLLGKPDYPLGEIYMRDRAQFMSPNESRKRWSTEPIERKKLSPWWLLKAGWEENAQTSFYLRWPNRPLVDDDGVALIAEEANLTPAHFRPGVLPTAADRTAGTAWRDPHHPFQARALQEALATYGSDPEAPIRKSVVRWGSAQGPTPWANPGNALNVGVNAAEAMNAWLVSVCGFPF